MRHNGKPSSRFALVVVGDAGYLRGVNAIINAMDYYGNKMDLLYIQDGIEDSYINAVLEADFNFRIEVIDYAELTEQFYADCPGMILDRFNYFCFVRHWLVPKIKERYSVVGLIEGDALLLDNITPWFEMTEGTDYLLTAYHVYQSFELENYTEKDLDFIQPLYVHPMICDPKKWDPFFRKMVELKNQTPGLIDMMAMNQAVLLSGRKDLVVVLNEAEWLGGFVYTKPVAPMTLNNGRRILRDFPSLSRIKMLHGKYFSDGFRSGVHAQCSKEHQEVFRENMIKIYELFRFFNDDLKVKLPQQYRFDMDRNLL